jgi:hypothetical protein
VTHRPHFDIHEIGLQEDCLRCRELSENPAQLDELNRQRLRDGDVYTRLDRGAVARLAVLERRRDEMQTR